MHPGEFCDPVNKFIVLWAYNYHGLVVFSTETAMARESSRAGLGAKEPSPPYRATGYYRP